MSVQTSGPIGTPSLDLPETLRVLWRRKPLFLIPWAVAMLVGLSAAFLLKPIYSSSVTLILEEPRPLPGVNAAAEEKAPSAETQADVMREQVKSSVFLHSVLTATGVRHDPETRGWALRNVKRLPGMSQDEAIDHFLVSRLKNGITIRRGRGNVFQVTVEDYDRDRARKLAAGVAEQFVVVSKRSQIEAVRATQAFSLEQQKIHKQRLDESEQRLESFQRSVLSSSGMGALPEANVPRARTLLEQATIEADDARQRAAQIRARLKGRSRENDHQLLTSSQTNALEGQIRSLERQLASAEVNETAVQTSAAAGVRLQIARKHSELEVELNVTAAKAFPMLAVDVREDLAAYRVALADVAGVEARKDWLATQVGSFERNVVLSPDRELDRQRLSQEVESNRQLYNSFLQQSSIAQIAEAFENANVGGRFRVLEPATRPLAPSKPNRPVLILLSLLVGIVVGTGTVLLVEHHDQSVKNAEEVENLLGLPVLGAIPRVEELESSRRRRNGAQRSRDQGLLHLKLESPLGLEFRRTYLKLKARNRPLPRSVLITSATRGEGKTTTSACLAITLARELKEKVLLADFDLRSPALHRALGLPSSSWGLAQVLGNRHFDERFVRATVLPNLEFLPAGRSERTAADLIDDESVEWFMQEATRRYPIVVLDAAPNLAVPDPLILGRSVEAVLYVIKAGSTVRKAAEYGVKVQREARDNVLGVLINDAGEVLPHYLGYRYNYYGYTTEASGADS